MKMDNASVLFLVSRSDVSQTIRCTYESNENVYGMWREIIKELNMENIVRIFNRQRLK